MTKVTNVRNETANTATTAPKEKAVHWVNIYRKGSRAPVDQIAGFPIDHLPDYIKAASHPDFIQDTFGSELTDAYHNIAGQSAKAPVSQDLSKYL